MYNIHNMKVLLKKSIYSIIRRLKDSSISVVMNSCEI